MKQDISKKHRKNRGKIKIQNIVASADLFSTPISMKLLVKKIEDIQYNPKKFPGACLRLDEPNVSILIFNSGRIVVAGAKNEESIHIAIRKLKTILKKMNIEFKKDYEMKVQNVVASGDVGFKLNLDELAFKVRYSEYNPEQFPGLVYKPPDLNPSFLLFNTGKIVCTGARSEEELVEATQVLISRLEELGYESK
jgi:transcription initiation factor TFIID TATA-box-binding protein